MMARLAPATGLCRAVFPVLFAMAGLMTLPCVHATERVVDLSKPVGESFKPDVLYWAFDDGAIDDWAPDPVVDLSGNGFDGKLTAGQEQGQPVYTKGVFGTGIRLTGNAPRVEKEDGSVKTHPNSRVTWSARDRSQNAPNPALLDLNDTSFTIGTWIRFDETAEQEKQTVYVFQRGTESAWGLLITRKPGGHFSLLFGAGGARAVTANTPDVFDDGKWHHVAVVYKVGGDQNLATFFLDGVPIGEPLPVAARPAVTEAKDRVFTMGERNVANYSNGLTGALDDAFVTTGECTFLPPK